ncbi:protein abrupt-like isoform X4 [Periplaneta americana]|uniref:protein abrupt-like isoform X4 n=1 Tax=Periplaneta americana TaxID=6978 RepID=UPI0037E94A1F
MSEEQQFCLRWNNFQANITSQFEALRDEEDFVDVTLACDGQRLKAHKVVLSACSPYFKELFKSNPCKHPILFLRDVAFHHLRALVEFMYAGEVNVAQAQLSAFLRTAESLQIRGLTEAPQRHKQAYIRQQHHQQSHHPQPQQQTNVPSEVVTGIGLDSSSAAEEIASSPECVGIDEDEDGLSMSPGGGSSPNPAKRQCLQQDGDITHQRAQTSTSSSHSDLRQELEVSSKDNPTELVEPKLELPDYSSDGESKTGTAAFLGLDSNSVDVNASFAAALHGGGMDILPGPSGQSFLGEPSGNLDSGQGMESGRTRQGRSAGDWSRILARDRRSGSGFVPESGDDGITNGLVCLGEGVSVAADQLRSLNWTDYRKLTRGLAAILFSPAELATRSVTGQRWSRAGIAGGYRPIKPALDRAKVQAIINHVTSRFPSVGVTKIKQVLAYKCKESASSFRVQNVRSFGYTL